MAKKAKPQYIHSTDQRYLERLQDEAENFNGLRTALHHGLLVIHYTAKPKVTRKKREEYDDEYDEYNA